MSFENTTKVYFDMLLLDMLHLLYDSMIQQGLNTLSKLIHIGLL